MTSTNEPSATHESRNKSRMFVFMGVMIICALMVGIIIGNAYSKKNTTADEMVGKLYSEVRGSSYCKSEPAQGGELEDCWQRLIDGRREGEGSAVLIRNGGEPYALFTFPGNELRTIRQVRVLTDVGIGEEKRWLKDFQIFTSQDGVRFSEAAGGVKGPTSGFEEFGIKDAPAARFAKIVFKSNYGDPAWTQVGEVEWFGN